VTAGRPAWYRLFRRWTSTPSWATCCSSSATVLPVRGGDALLLLLVLPVARLALVLLRLVGGAEEGDGGFTAAAGEGPDLPAAGFAVGDLAGGDDWVAILGECLESGAGETERRFEGGGEGWWLGGGCPGFPWCPDGVLLLLAELPSLLAA
jgi:hypothetical protein